MRERVWVDILYMVCGRVRVGVYVYVGECGLIYECKCEGVCVTAWVCRCE